jgi:hypothetical protein
VTPLEAFNSLSGGTPMSKPSATSVAIQIPVAKPAATMPLAAKKPAQTPATATPVDPLKQPATLKHTRATNLDPLVVFSFLFGGKPKPKFAAADKVKAVFKPVVKPVGKATPAPKLALLAPPP